MSRNFPVGSILISFDMVTMFSKIPISRAAPILIKILEQENIHTDFINEFKNLLSICLQQNICVIKNKTYKFPDGLPMDGPLSVLGCKHLHWPSWIGNYELQYLRQLYTLLGPLCRRHTMCMARFPQRPRQFFQRAQPTRSGKKIYTGNRQRRNELPRRHQKTCWVPKCAKNLLRRLQKRIFLRSINP